MYKTILRGALLSPELAGCSLSSYFCFTRDISRLNQKVRLQRSGRRKGGVTILVNSILIVDDDIGVRNMLSSVLYDGGYLIEGVENGKEAIKACEESFFDVALIDIELPDMKGTELLNRLKKLQPKMIRIIITGHPSIENAMKAVNERADGYLLKPFEVTELLKMIARLLTERMNEYLRISTEITRAKENTPAVKYLRPER
jgi:DNA-binding NtrC family response regulator